MVRCGLRCSCLSLPVEMGLILSIKGHPSGWPFCAGFDSRRFKIKDHPDGWSFILEQGTGIENSKELPPSSRRQGNVHRTFPFEWVRFPPSPKRRPPHWGGLLFGAGYGNRTRLRGLGSHYNSRYTNPAFRDAIITKGYVKSNHFLSEGIF